jgi:hypothetical protein
MIAIPNDLTVMTPSTGESAEEVKVSLSSAPSAGDSIPG